MPVRYARRARRALAARRWLAGMALAGCSLPAAAVPDATLPAVNSPAAAAPAAAAPAATAPPATAPPATAPVPTAPAATVPASGNPGPALAELERQATRHPAQAQRALEAWMERAPTLAKHDRLQLELIRAVIACSQSRSSDVLAITDGIATRLAELDDPRLLALSQHERGSAFYDLGRLVDAWHALELETAQVLRTGDRDGYAMVITNRVRLLLKRGDFAAAALSLAELDMPALGDQAGAEVAYSRTVLDKNLEDWQPMLQDGRDALRRFTAVHDSTGMADAQAAIGEALTGLGRPAEAITPLDAAAGLYREEGDADGEATVDLDLAWARFDDHQTAQALTLGARAVALLEGIDEPWRLADARLDQADFLAAAGQAAAAFELYGRARPAVLEEGELRIVVRLHEVAARILAALGRHQEAYQESLLARQGQRARTAQLLAHQLAAQRGGLEGAALAKENSLLRAQADSDRHALAAAARAARFQHLALLLGAGMVAGALLAAWRQRQLNDRIARLAEIDELTGVRNRRSLLEVGQRVIDRGLADSTTSAVLMLDVDRFKDVNDQHGHLAGDRALRAVSDALRLALRPADLIGRYGGEEFLVILPATDRDEARAVAERLRQAIAVLPPDWAAGAAPLTLSGGIAIAEGGVVDLNDLLACADRALYRAKEGGRNRMEFAGTADSSATG